MIHCVAHAALSLIQNLQAADTTVFHLINRHWAEPFLDPVMVYATQLGLGGYQIALLALLGIFGGPVGRRTALLCLLAFVVSGVAAQILKHTFNRLRPASVLDDCRCLDGILKLHSFPSGHAATSFAIAVVAAAHSRRWGIPLLLLAGLVAYSRVYVGAHFPSDALGGALIGIATGLACLYYDQRLRRRKRVGTATHEADRETVPVATGGMPRD